MNKRAVTKLFLALLCTILIVSTLSACTGKRLEEQLVGSWFAEGTSTPVFTLKEDGTLYADGHNGTWTVVNEDQLQILGLGTGMYGEDEVLIFTVEGLDAGCLTLNYKGNSRQLWNTPC